jgi:hypothetical protein
MKGHRSIQGSIFRNLQAVCRPSAIVHSCGPQHPAVSHAKTLLKICAASKNKSGSRLTNLRVAGRRRTAWRWRSVPARRRWGPRPSSSASSTDDRVSEPPRRSSLPQPEAWPFPLLCDGDMLLLVECRAPAALRPTIGWVTHTHTPTPTYTPTEGRPPCPLF